MKEQIRRVRQFASDHHTALACTAGVIVGVTVTAFILSKRGNAIPSEIEVLLRETPQQLKDMLEASNGGVKFVGVDSIVTLITEADVD